METKFVTITKAEPQSPGIREAARIIQNGGLTAFPTETVYGLGGNALDADASRKIYKAKGRPSDNPLIVHIADFEELPALVSEIPDAARVLMRLYWPGPMTLIFRKTERVPSGTTGGLDTVAVRMPSHPVARALIRAAQVPIAAPSANLSGRPSPTKASHVWEDMKGRIDLILDGGEVGIGLESTIVDVTGPVPALLRPGYISEQMLQEALGRITVDAASIGPVSAGLRPKAPGMKYRHYAPEAPLTLVRGEPARVEKAICFHVKEALLAGEDVGVLCALESLPLYRGRLGADCSSCPQLREMSCECRGPEKKGDGRLVLAAAGARQRPEEIAHNLYDVLRFFDSVRVGRIFSECFEDGELAGAVMNRLEKAAGYHRMDV